MNALKDVFDLNSNYSLENLSLDSRGAVGDDEVFKMLDEIAPDFYIFHDDKKQYYIVSSKKLKQWVENIIENQQHRVVWGGYQKHTLQIQIRLNELEQLGHYVDLRKKRGKKLTEDKA